MAKKDYLARYLLIIKKVSGTDFTSFDELSQYIQRHNTSWSFLDETLDLQFSKRTLQRDLREIRSLYGIDIEYSRKNNGYYIVNTTAENKHFKQLLNQFELYSLFLKESSRISKDIVFESNDYLSTNHMALILQSIGDKREIVIEYKPHYKDDSRFFTIQPYGLRENSKLWYVMGKEDITGDIKMFGIDRILSVRVTGKSFEGEVFDQSTYFEHVYGIDHGDAKEPETVTLTFTNLQGKYVLNNPLHHSQKHEIMDPKNIKISMTVKPNEQLEMDLMSFGESLIDIKPDWLKNKIIKRHAHAARILINDDDE